MSNQPIKLQLNADAIAALFPEGSQARVELQNAVIAEFCRKNIKNSLVISSSIEKKIEAARSQVIEDAVFKLGMDKGSYGTITVGTAVKEKIHVAVRDAMMTDVNNMIGAMVETLRGTIEHNAKVAVNRMTDKMIADILKERVQKVTQGLLGA